jgi:cellulose synthase/poly-beta-1,6-N-acetylglucosamine synthase-like glycosyltransferase
VISIIIPAFNEEKNIGRCLDGLRNQIDVHDDSEVIVIDDGSTDATREIAKAHGARVLAQPNQGAAAARNFGARQANGEIILFTDADCVPDPKWVAAMLAPFAESDVVGVGGMKKTRQTEFMPRFIQLEFDYRYDRVRTHRYIDFIDSGTAAYRRDIFLENNGFDTLLADAEDVELSFRLSQQGFKMAFAPAAIVYREHQTSLWEYLRLKFTYAYWRSYVYKRFPQKIAADSRTPQTQKIAGGLVLLLPFVILASLFWSQAIWLTAAIVIVLLATSFPFVVRYWKRDPIVAFFSPVMIALSACAVGWGVAIGAMSQSGRAAK